MNTIIQRLDGTTYDLEELGITTRDFVISSPSPRHFTETVDTRHGVVDMGTVYDARTINASFYAKADDMDDYALMRDEIFRLFRTQEPFYVIESRSPEKRWRVKVANSFGLDQQRIYGFFDVEFVAYSGFAESVETTLSSSLFAAQLTGLGTRIIQYRHSTAGFEIFNDGDMAVDPRYFPLVIEYKGASTNLEIKNNTTGDMWKYTGTSSSSDTLKLDGIRSTKNGLSIFRNSNRKLISLAPGWNDFDLSGTSGSFEITFDFRFYTL